MKSPSRPTPQLLVWITGSIVLVLVIWFLKIPSLTLKETRVLQASNQARVEFSEGDEVFVRDIKNRCVALTRWRAIDGSVDSLVIDLDGTEDLSVYAGSIESYQERGEGRCVLVQPAPVFAFTEDYSLIARVKGDRIKINPVFQEGERDLVVSEVQFEPDELVLQLEFIAPRILAAVIWSEITGSGRLWLRDLEEEDQEEKGFPLREGWRINDRSNHFLVMAPDLAQEVGVLWWNDEHDLFEMNWRFLSGSKSDAVAFVRLSEEGCVAGGNRLLAHVVVLCPEEEEPHRIEADLGSRVATFLARNRILAAGEFSGLRVLEPGVEPTEVKMPTSGRVIDLDYWNGHVAYVTDERVAVGRLVPTREWDFQRVSLVSLGVGVLALIIGVFALRRRS